MKTKNKQRSNTQINSRAYPRSLKGTSNSTCPWVIPSTLSIKFLNTDFNLCLNSLSACKYQTGFVRFEQLIKNDVELAVFVPVDHLLFSRPQTRRSVKLERPTVNNPSVTFNDSSPFASRANNTASCTVRRLHLTIHCFLVFDILLSFSVSTQTPKRTHPFHITVSFANLAVVLDTQKNTLKLAIFPQDRNNSQSCKSTTLGNKWHKRVFWHCRTNE